MEAPPVVYGKYLLERPLARGGMGAVWVALDPQLKRRVALKTMHREALSAPPALERFAREAATIAQLQSPHVVQVFDFGVTDSVPYIAMELLSGEDLAARLERVHRFPLQAFVKIFEQIAKALTAAHAAGIIHRDLKPANVFITQSGPEEVVKLVDFGIAAGGEGLSDAEAGDPSRLSEIPGAILGTPWYMSPEQARGRPLDHRSDLWSLGVVAYQALTGRLPFPASRVNDVIIAICADPIVPPSVLVPELGLDVDRFFERALARDPEDRFQSAQEMAAAFFRLAEPDTGPRAAKILVVDDEADMPALIRQRFRRRIQDGSLSFLFAADGLEALEQLRLHPDVDVVVSDIRMPHMDGLTMLARVSEISPLTKVILVSAFGDMANIREAMNRGAFDFLVKPVDFKDLQATIDKTVTHVRDARRTARSIRENDVLRMFVSHHVADDLSASVRGVGAPRGDAREGTVAFIGVVHPEGGAGPKVIEAANLAMEIIVPEILVRGGTVSRFTEEGVLAFFQGEDHVTRAITTAVAARSEMQRRLRRGAGDDAGQIHGRAGIASGTVTHGAVGARSLRRMEYIVCGAPVRTALQLAQVAEPDQILVEESLYELSGATFEAQPLPPPRTLSQEVTMSLLNVTGRAPTGQHRPEASRTTAVLTESERSISRIVAHTARNGTTDP